jgi:hypothetical protein
MARERDCGRVTVRPDERSSSFYERLGFRQPMLLSVLRLRGPFPEADCLTPAMLADGIRPANARLLTQRVIHPAQTWAMLLDEETHMPEDRRRDGHFVHAFAGDAQTGGGILAAFRILRRGGRTAHAGVYVWGIPAGPDELLPVLASAGSLGLEELTIRAHGAIADWLTGLGAETVGHEAVLCADADDRRLLPAACCPLNAAP